MTSKGPVVIKQLPPTHVPARRKSFLAEIQTLSDQSSRPQLVVDLSASRGIGADAIDLLLQCVEHVERADGRVSVAGSPETAVILELTRLTSVLDMFSSVSEAVDGDALPRVEPGGDSQPLAA
jgi:anti-anti-sigma regulatory factor